MRESRTEDKFHDCRLDPEPAVRKGMASSVGTPCADGGYYDLEGQKTKFTEGSGGYDPQAHIGRLRRVG
jgi:hypothetical protein